MDSINIPAIEAYARELRAQEIRRLEGLFAERIRLYFLLLGSSLLTLLEMASETLRPLFSWNPQAAAVHAAVPSLTARLNRAARALFAWNPQRRRPC